MNFELIIDADVELAETPIWDERLACLYWTDLFTGEVHQYHPATQKEKVFETGAMIGSAIPCDDPTKLLVALEHGMHLLDMRTNQLDFLSDPNQGNPANRYNDTRVDARGRIFTSTVSKMYGTADYQPDMRGDFYMIDRDGRVEKILSDINQLNAIVWNRDSSRMYVVDTFNEKLLVFDYDLEKGPLGSPAELVDFAPFGMPDGMSIDQEDNLYVCHWTGKLSLWDKDGNLIQTMAFPVDYACCSGFGGSDMKDLYVASSKYAYSEQDLEKNPGAGGIFRARHSIAGSKEHFYRI